MSTRAIPGRGFGRGGMVDRNFATGDEGDGEEATLDDAVPVPRSRPLGRLASRRNLTMARRPTLSSAPSQRGVEATRSGESLDSVAASLSSGERGLPSPAAVASAPARNAEENWLRASLARSSGGGGSAGGFDMNAINAALQEDEDLYGGFDDEEVLEQYRIMAQHEAALRVKANTGFDLDDYEKRRKTSGNEVKDKKELYGGGKKPKIGLPPPQFVVGHSEHNGNNHSAGSFSHPPTLPLGQEGGYGLTKGSNSVCLSENYILFLQEQHIKAVSIPELSQGEVVRNPNTPTSEGEHIVRCWACRANLRVNYVSTLVQCPECKTVSQTRKK